MPSSRQPSGLCAACTEPRSRQTKFPVVQVPASSTRLPSNTNVCSIPACRCKGSCAPASHRNNPVNDSLRSSCQSIFMVMPGNWVGCHASSWTSMKCDPGSLLSLATSSLLLLVFCFPSTLLLRVQVRCGCFAPRLSCTSWQFRRVVRVPVPTR